MNLCSLRNEFESDVAMTAMTFAVNDYDLRFQGNDTTAAQPIGQDMDSLGTPAGRLRISSGGRCK